MSLLAFDLGDTTFSSLPDHFVHHAVQVKHLIIFKVVGVCLDVTRVLLDLGINDGFLGRAAGGGAARCVGTVLCGNRIDLEAALVSLS